ncbi:MAG: class III poly(R)-hydroxyalkanoic acid synthase subunit PhaE, partial [Gammaproteobacteria bacterium]|nr:class III poly(R)-hydroxyalkanoic acid synthase subunit PhaE [Gammaproteobacteria bacterium]
MATSTAQGAGDFEALARQYWNAWGEAMRQGGVPHAGTASAATAGVPGWQDAVEWWSKLAHGGREEANAAVGRFNAQAKQWYGQMQQVAAQFAGQDASAADIASEWKRALGAVGENPFPELFRAMHGKGQQGLEQWIEDASPYLDAWRREGSSWLGIPAFGLNREHQERLQALVQAQLDYQQRSGAYNALMAKSAQHAYALFEYKLGEREQPGRQLTSARALFDLWIDAAEEAYAQVALSPEFREVYGALVNAQMRVRAGVQREVEQISTMFGMPTRSELDGAHRKLAELERVMRRMRDAADTDVRTANPQWRRSAAPSPRPSPQGRTSEQQPVSK